MGGEGLTNLRNLALWVLVGLVVVLLFNLFQGSSHHTSPPPLSYSQFRQVILDGDVKRVTIEGDQVRGELANGNQFTTTIPLNDQSFWTLLNDHHVNVRVSGSDEGMPPLLVVLLNWFPLLVLIGALGFFLRRTRHGEVHNGVPRAELNWRRGLLRTWIVASVLWLGIWASVIWNACRMEYVCWLGSFVPGMPYIIGASAGQFKLWAWTAVLGEGLAVPAAVFVLGYIIIWALEGFRHSDQS
jgi:hypothetical protein